MSPLDKIRNQIANHPTNAWARKLGYAPVYTAGEHARILIIGQAPGRKAQATYTPWNDISGIRLRQWLGLSDEQFYNPGLVALMPMDFYYPGKGKHGDLPPRSDFARKWHPKLLTHMPDIQLTILIGAYSQKHYLADKRKPNLSQTVLAYEEYLPEYFPIVHPSPLNFRWLAINPWFEAEVIPALRDKVTRIISA